jgi:transposase
VSPGMVVKWRRLAEKARYRAEAQKRVSSGVRVKALKTQVRELERLLGRKTMEAVTLKEADH